jgi:hypothetical protein
MCLLMSYDLHSMISEPVPASGKEKRLYNGLISSIIECKANSILPGSLHKAYEVSLPDFDRVDSGAIRLSVSLDCTL